MKKLNFTVQVAYLILEKKHMSSIWHKIKSFFSGMSSDSGSASKKFIVTNTVTQRNPQRTSSKKFTITNVAQRATNNRGFSRAQVSRPRKCPRCGTEGCVIKANNNYWECSEGRNGCGYKWK